MLSTLLVANGIALAALLLLAHRDVALVDEAGRPLDRSSDWLAQRVPAEAAAEAPLSV